jgi:PPIC-type PPIASE domain
MERNQYLSSNPQELWPAGLVVQACPVLSVDDLPLSLGQVFKYLESSGKLESVLWDVLCQHVIERELQMNSGVIEQAMIDFRLQHQLSDPECFQVWLDNQELDYAAFRNQLAFRLKLERLEKLKAEVVGSRVQAYFIERKLFLDRVVLSRLVVQEQTLAEELKSQILEDGARFEPLVQAYSIAGDRIVNGMMGALSRGNLPEVLRAVVDPVNPGELIGPLELDGLWYLVRIETFLPASFDEQLEQDLAAELFEQWLAEKVQQLDAQLLVNF